MQEIKTDKAPKAIGPYSQAIVAGQFIFCSGQIAIDPKTAELVPGGIKEQILQVFQNLKMILESAGVSLKDVVRVDVFLKNMDDYAHMNEIYSEKISHEPKPARLTVEVSKLPKNALIEISCIAYKS